MSTVRKLLLYLLLSFCCGIVMIDHAFADTRLPQLTCPPMQRGDDVSRYKEIDSMVNFTEEFPKRIECNYTNGVSMTGYAYKHKYSDQAQINCLNKKIRPTISGKSQGVTFDDKSDPQSVLVKIRSKYNLAYVLMRMPPKIYADESLQNTWISWGQWLLQSIEYEWAPDDCSPYYQREVLEDINETLRKYNSKGK